jgi:hypothetical protein
MIANMLQLAPATLPEVPARGNGTASARLDGPVVAETIAGHGTGDMVPVGRYPVAPQGQPHDVPLSVRRHPASFRLPRRTRVLRPRKQLAKRFPMKKLEPWVRPGRVGILLLLSTIAGCAAAPLYTDGSRSVAVTRGEIPRDSRGEPVWHLIRAAPPPVAVVTAPAPVDTAEGSRPGGAPPR